MDSDVTNNNREERAIDEAEFEPSEFAGKMVTERKTQEQQLEMLKQNQKYNPEYRSASLENRANFGSSAAIFTPDQIQEVVRRTSPKASG